MGGDLRTCAVALALLLTVCTQAYAAGAGFVGASGFTFYDKTSCRPVIPLGWNTWVDLTIGAASIASGLEPTADLTIQDDSVTSLFTAAQNIGLDTLRLFGHGDSTLQLQTGPGQYDENAWRGFDYVLAQAALHNIRVIWVTVNNWLNEDEGGGKLAYCKWAGIDNLDDNHSGAAEDQFWTNEKAMQLVKDHYSVLVNRTNYFTGVQYKNDPTIFSWDLLNEPRCPASQSGPGCSVLVTAWYNEMASFMKTLDDNHMVRISIDFAPGPRVHAQALPNATSKRLQVSTGEEGFLARAQKAANPLGVPSNIVTGQYWASDIGQDYIAQHQSADMDYGAVHMWPDNWNTLDAAFPSVWLGNHSIASVQLGKPWLLQEFGKKAINGDQDRTATYAATYDALLGSLQSGGSFRGALFWSWANQDGASGADATEILNQDSTYQLIKDRVAQIREIMTDDSSITIPACQHPFTGQTAAAAVESAGR